VRGNKKARSTGERAGSIAFAKDYPVAPVERTVLSRMTGASEARFMNVLLCIAAY
jgi:hypothetical protein